MGRLSAETFDATFHAEEMNREARPETDGEKITAQMSARLRLQLPIVLAVKCDQNVLSATKVL